MNRTQNPKGRGLASSAGLLGKAVNLPLRGTLYIPDHQVAKRLKSINRGVFYPIKPTDHSAVNISNVLYN